MSDGAGTPRRSGTPRRHVVIGPEHVGRTPTATPPGPAPRPAAPPRPPARPGPGGAGGRPPGPPPPRSRPAPPPRGPRPPGQVRRRVVLAVVAVLVALALLLVGVLAFGWWQFSRIERVDVSSAVSPASSGTNYLIVGSDSRTGIGEDDPNAGAFLGGETPAGERTDTIMVLRVDGSERTLLSIPRDLWVRNPATGEMGRINSVYQSGPAALVQAVTDLGIPIQHFVEIDFVSFAGLVDAVGGITVEFPHPARDEHSGLYVDEAGPVTLDGTQALAYVRSRYYEELVGGAWQTDPTADLGRVQRQRAFLSALLGKVADTRNPLGLTGIASALGPGLRLDSGFSFPDALGLAWDLRGGFEPESVTLPVVPRTTSGGAQVLELQAAQAQPVIQRFGG